MTASITERDTALDPVKVRGDRVTLTASNNRPYWVGHQVVVTLRNGTEHRCGHVHGHGSRSAFTKCAKATVNRLNRAAGTTTAAVEAGKRANTEVASA